MREGHAGQTELEFTVTLFPESDTEVRVDYSTVGDSARARSDYEPVQGTLRFDPGEGAETVTVPVKGDRLDEDDEVVLVYLRDAVGAPVEEDEGEGLILDDDLAPTFTVSDVAVLEGDDGTVEALVRAKLSEESGRVVSFAVATEDGSATSPADYTATSGTLSFPPGETVVRFPVAVVGDDASEEDEDFKVVLDDVVNAAVARSEAVVEIVEDDSPVAERVPWRPTRRGTAIGSPPPTGGCRPSARPRITAPWAER